MGEIYDSLDCRLKVSGMVADSIMMGIVNSAMEEAYKKVCSKEGDLECLNEKSRFCELALMQLEWCLKFMQEEMDSYIVESSRERENLVFDLTNARDRMQKRLEETELAIAEKDRELTERLENESKLRQSLESKDEELSSLRATLELERTKKERVQEFVLSNQTRRSNDRCRNFCEMKNSMDQQFWNIKQKLEDRMVHLTDRIHMNQSCGDTLKLEPALLESVSELAEEGNCNPADMRFGAKSEEERNDGCKRIGFFENDFNCETEVFNSYTRMELNIAIQQMGVDIDILKEMLEMAFEMMDNAISSSKLVLMEEKWARTVEEETLSFVLQSFLREIQENFEKSQRNYKVPQDFFVANWSALMDDITSLRHVLEVLVIQNEVQSEYATGHQFGTHTMKGNGINILQRCGKSDSALRFEKLHLEDPAKEDSVGNPHHHVAVIRNREPIVTEKAEEIDRMQGVLKEKGHPPSRKDKDPNAVKNMIPKEENRANVLQRCGQSDSSLRFDELLLLQDPPTEDTGGHTHHYVAEMIRNHECIIKKKTEEINWLRGQILTEKGRTRLRKDKDLDALHQMIPRVISRLDHFIKENGKLSAVGDGSDSFDENYGQFLPEHLTRPVAIDRDNTVICMSADLPEKSHNLVVCPSTHVNSREEIRQLRQEREDLDMQATIMKETCTIVFEGFMEGIRLELDISAMEDLIRDDVCTVFFREMAREWNSEMETYSIESLVREEICKIVVSEVVKDIQCTVNFMLEKCQEAEDQEIFLEDLSLTSSSPQILNSEKKNSIQQLDSMPNFAEVEEDLTFNGSPQLMQDYMHFDPVNQELEEIREHNIDPEGMLIEKDDTFFSVNSKLEKALQQIIETKAQLKELGSSLGIAVGGLEEAQDQMVSIEGIIQEGETNWWLANGEQQQTAFNSFVAPLKDFSGVIKDFENMLHEKIGHNIVRLQEVNHQLNPLIEQISSLRKRELLYRKAFIRRCYDLQTAEAEVDLLGDEVDELFDLLEKTYIALDHYSPVLQNYSGEEISLQNPFRACLELDTWNAREKKKDNGDSQFNQKRTKWRS